MTSYGLDEGDSDQCSKRLELDLISLLVNFSCELGQIMTRYDFLWARWVISEQCSDQLKLYLILLLVNVLGELGQIITRFLFRWTGANNNQIWLPMDQTSDSEQCLNRLQLGLILLVNFSCQLFSSAVPSGSGAFQMPTRPSSSSAAASTLRGKGQSQKRFSNFFSFLAWGFFGMTLTTYHKKDFVESL